MTNFNNIVNPNENALTEAFLAETLDLINMQKELEATIKARKAMIEAAADAQGIAEGMCGNRYFKVKRTETWSLDTKRIKAELPEVYEELGKAGTRTTITVK